MPTFQMTKYVFLDAHEAIVCRFSDAECLKSRLGSQPQTLWMVAMLGFQTLLRGKTYLCISVI